MDQSTKKLSKRIFRSVLVTMLAIVLTLLEPTGVASAAAKKSKSAKDYYQSIEKTGSEKAIDALTNMYGVYVDSFNTVSKGYGAKMNIKATVAPTLAALLDMEDLKNLEADITTMQNSEKASYQVSLSANDKQFTTLNVLSDLKKDIMYLLVPDLSKAYLKMPGSSGSYGSVSSTSQVYDFFNSNKLSEKTLNKLLKKYSAILYKDLDDVKVYDNSQVTAKGVKEDCTKVVVKIDTKTALSITEKVLKAAQKDNDLKNLCADLKLCSKKDYTSGIKVALNNIKDAKAKAKKKNPNFATMTLYVDGKGCIIGREFSFNKSAGLPSFGYKVTEKGKNTGMDIWLKDGKEQVKITGKLTTDNKAVTGDISLDYTDTKGKKSQPFTMKLDNVTFTKASNSGGYYNGKMTFAGDILSGISLVVNCSGSDTQQLMDMDIIQSGSCLMSLSMNTKLIDYKDFSLPSGSDVVYDLNTEIEKYIKSSDVKKYLQGINEKIDIKAINLYLDEMIKQY